MQQGSQPAYRNSCIMPPIIPMQLTQPSNLIAPQLPFHIACHELTLQPYGYSHCGCCDNRAQRYAGTSGCFSSSDTRIKPSGRL